MKKLLLFVAVLLGSVAMSYGQTTVVNVGIIGDATPKGWDANTDMMTTDNNVFTLTNFDLVAGKLKFRQGAAWSPTTNWGGSALVGTGVADGGNITIATAGKYDISFNLTTLKYSIAPAGVVPFAVSIKGVATADLAIDLSSTDNNVFMAAGVTLVDGGLRFTVAQGETATVYEGTTFAQGTAVVASEGSIPATAGKYDVTFNKTTLAYTFAPAADPVKTIAIIGAATPGGWDTETPMTKNETTGLWEVKDLVLTVGAFKFRANSAWDINWGVSATAGVAAQGGTDLTNETAGTFDITFNRTTGEYVLTNKGLSTVSFDLNGNPITYTNPSQGGVIKLSVPADVVLTTINGVKSEQNDVENVDVSRLPKGLNFISINGSEPSKIIVE